MSQYGQVSGNYYLPKPKFNTLRPTIYYAIFTAYIFVLDYCLQIVEPTVVTPQLPYSSIEWNCTQSITEIYSLVFTSTFGVINATNCTAQFTKTDFVDYSPTYIQDNSTVVNNFCSLDTASLIIPAQTVIAPPAYTAGLYQETVIDFCEQTVQQTVIPVLTYYTTDNNCTQAIEEILPISILLVPITVATCQAIYEAEDLSFNPNYLANNRTTVNNSCSPTYETEIITIDSNYLSNNII